MDYGPGLGGGERAHALAIKRHADNPRARGPLGRNHRYDGSGNVFIKQKQRFYPSGTVNSPAESALAILENLVRVAVEEMDARIAMVQRFTDSSDARLEQVIGILGRNSNTLFNTRLAKNSVQFWMRGLNQDGFAFGVTNGLTLDYHATLELMKE